MRRDTGTAITWTDRLRIEWLLSRLDTHLQSLPGSSRRAIRRELRANLRASAAEVGAAEAINRLGRLHQLAAGYLDAEYADRPRPRYLKALFWVVAVEVVIFWSAFIGHSAFMSGVEAADPHPIGAFAWEPPQALAIGGSVAYDDRGAYAFGLSFNQWTVMYLAAAFVIGGRMWRIVPRWRRRREHPRTAAAEA